MRVFNYKEVMPVILRQLADDVENGATVILNLDIQNEAEVRNMSNMNGLIESQVLERVKTKLNFEFYQDEEAQNNLRELINELLEST